MGSTGLEVTRLGFGAFKVGRNQKIKYPEPYPLPSDAEARRLLNSVLDSGINYIDTAPAYGSSEERIGRSLAHRRQEFVLSTKAGETFRQGQSRYCYSRQAIERSVSESLERLKTAWVDILFLHSNGEDMAIQLQSDAVAALVDLKQRGLTRAIGFSGYTSQGFRTALEWADVIMVEFNARNTEHRPILELARKMERGVVVKKGLASGRLAPRRAIQFLAADPYVDTLLIGSLNPQHLAEDIAALAVPGAETES